MSRQTRGVQDVKTHSSVLGSGAHSNERHVHQFQLAALELEHTRRVRDKQAARRRLAEIEARLVEIAELMAKRREALGLVLEDQPDTERTTVRKESGETPPEARRVLRY